MKFVRNSRFAVSVIFAINGVVFGTWASRIPEISDLHNLSPGALGLLIFLLGFSAVIAFSVFGRAADRYGASTVTKRTTCIFIPLTLIFIALANSIWALAAAIIFFGVIHGGDDVAMNAWAAEVERKDERPLMSSSERMSVHSCPLFMQCGALEQGLVLGQVSSPLSIKLLCQCTLPLPPLSFFWPCFPLLLSLSNQRRNKTAIKSHLFRSQKEHCFPLL